MRKMLHRVNHMLGINLSQPLGRRGKAVLITLGLALVVAQIQLFAQSQTDCLGEYEGAMLKYSDMYNQAVRDAAANYSFWNPMRNAMQIAAQAEYLGRAEIAMYQMVACTAAPVFKST